MVLCRCNFRLIMTSFLQVPNNFQPQQTLRQQLFPQQNIKNFPQSQTTNVKPNKVQLKQPVQNPAAVIISSSNLPQASQQLLYSNIPTVQGTSHIILQNAPKILPANEQIRTQPVLVQNIAQLPQDKMQQVLLQVGRLIFQ